MDGSASVNETDAKPFPVVAVTPVGAVGRLDGTAGGLDGVEGKLGPKLFVAVTVQVYASPSVKEATVVGLDAAEPIPVAPPLLDVQVAVELVMVISVSVNDTTRDASAGVLGSAAVTLVGVFGTGSGSTALDAAEAVVPSMLTALTMHV